jgi:KaiC/GvpD/RAD55 family RecA-like ATPase
MFPIAPRNKQPLTGRGYLEATTDPDRLHAWWARWPDANLGLAPGMSGLVVIDVDGPEGAQHAQRLGLLAEPTLEAATGRVDGGRHLVFQRPPFAVSNTGLAPHLDVRGDMGYVLVAPSIHPSGAVYRWLNPGTIPICLPPGATDALRAVQGTGRPGIGAPRAADIPTLEVIAEGGRNEQLTRYVGRLLAKGHTAVEAYETALALNEARCRPPLPSAEVWAIVQSLAGRELRKPSRQTATGQTLQMAHDEPEVPPDFAALAEAQAEAAIARGRLDLSTSPRWRWTDLHRMMGEMLPGDFWVVGSLMGNGKTALLMSQMDAFVDAGVTTLYLPLELNPADLRRRWAAWKLRLDPVAVARNHWHLLPEGAQDAHEAMIAEQAHDPHVRFPDDRRPTLARLAYWIQHGVQQLGARIVVIDHFHRLDFGPASTQYRVQITDTVRALKDAAVRFGVVILASAQLNQSEINPLDRYFPPQLRRLKESAGIGEEADAVLMLSRRLRGVVDRDTAALIRAGLKSERDVAEPNVMTATCRKHRLDDAVAGDRSILLHVEQGRVTDHAPAWRAESWSPQ